MKELRESAAELLSPPIKSKATPRHKQILAAIDEKKVVR